MKTITAATIRKFLAGKTDVSRVKYTKPPIDRWYCYGRMPNSVQVGWWYAGTSAEVAAEIRAETAR
jgi:hypothetical protein